MHDEYWDGRVRLEDAAGSRRSDRSRDDLIISNRKDGEARRETRILKALGRAERPSIPEHLTAPPSHAGLRTYVTVREPEVFQKRATTIEPEVSK